VPLDKRVLARLAFHSPFTSHAHRHHQHRSPIQEGAAHP
jgi:hypothetical protein